jgi:hypothetical protein
LSGSREGDRTRLVRAVRRTLVALACGATTLLLGLPDRIASPSGYAGRAFAQTSSGSDADRARQDAADRARGTQPSDDNNNGDDSGPSRKGGGDLSGQIEDLDTGTATVGQNKKHVAAAPKTPKKRVASATATQDLNSDELIEILSGLDKAGWTNGPVRDPHDADTQVKFNNALVREEQTQEHLEHEFARMQNDVASALNAYLTATSAWQQKFAMISSASTTLQGLLADWEESKAIYEKADFAFAMANLATGGVKVGFKVVKWISKARAASAAVAEAAQAANGGRKLGAGVYQALGTGSETAGGGSKLGAGTYQALGTGSEAVAEGGEAASGLSKTKKFDKVLAPPGTPAGATKVPANQMFTPIAEPSVAGSTARATGIGGQGAQLATAQAEWAQQVAKMQGLLNKAKKAGNAETVARIENDLKSLMAAKPTSAAQVAVATNDAAALAEAQAGWEADVVKARTDLAKAKANNAPPSFVELAQNTLDDLLKKGKPTSVPKPIVTAPVNAIEAARDALSPDILNTAKEAGVDVTGTIKDLAGNISPAAVEEAEWNILRAVAEARGWHDIPVESFNSVVNALIEARKALAGVKDARLTMQSLANIKKIKRVVEAKGLNFFQWLATAGGESEVVGEVSVVHLSAKAGEVAGKGKEIVRQTEGIVLLFDQEDLTLLKQILDANGDINKLRTLVGPIEQISLNALAMNAAGGAVNANRAAAPVAVFKPTDQQVNNILTGSGQLGEVGLSNVELQFGVLDRVKDKNLFRAGLGEMWELITSPSATVASYRYTWVAQDELEDLTKNYSKEITGLGTDLDDASRALSNLQTALNRAGVDRPDSYLNKGGPDELRKILDDLQKAFNSGSEGWKKDHQQEMDGRREHIEQKLADLADAMKELAAIKTHMGKMRAWLDSVRLNPDGSVKTPLEAFNPQTYVRLAAISLYARSVAAAAFGLTQDVPFHVVPAKDIALNPPKPAGQPTPGGPSPPNAGVQQAANDDDDMPKSSLPPNRRMGSQDVRPDGPDNSEEEDKSFDEFMHKIWREERKEKMGGK